MAEVFKGLLGGIGGFSRFVAIKKILPHLAEDQRFLEMFSSEARLALQLNHANIVQTLELDQHKGDHFIAMEYIAGKDLLSLHNYFRRQKQRMAVDLIAYIAARVAGALDYAHRKRGEDGQPLNVIHRDISPQNVLISFDGVVKLIDFGIAKARSNEHEPTQAGVLKGKFGYMSPEQVLGNPIDQRSDIFSLGTVIHEMLTGQRLFFGENQFQTLDLVEKAQVSPPSKSNPEVNHHLDHIIQKALAREPDQRYSSAAALAEDLERYLHSRGQSLSHRPLSDWMAKHFSEQIAEEKEKNGGWIDLSQPEEEDEETSLWDQRSQDLSLPPPEPPPSEPPPSWIHTEEETGKQEPVKWINAETAQEELNSLNSLEPHHNPLPLLPSQSPNNRRDLLIAGIIFSLAIVGAIFAFLMTESPGDEAGLIIRVEPEKGIIVSLDQQPLGTQSPVVAKNLKPGSYKLLVKGEGFHSWSDQILLKAGALEKREVRLEPMERAPALLSLQVYPPQARVRLNGQLLSPKQQRSALSLRGGEAAEIRLETDGYQPLLHKITLASGERKTLSLKMSPTRGTLFIDSEPPADVYLNDRRVGRSPYNVRSLDVTRPWKIQVKRNGYLPYEELIRFGDRRFIQLECKLKRH